MAEKRKGVKWIIVLSVLVLIAIAVTLTLVLMPKNINKAIEQTDKQAGNMFIVKDENKELYQDFQEKIKNTAEEKYRQETDNVYKLSLSLNKIIGFYRENIVFAENSKVFQKNYKKIMNGFKNADKYQQKMEEVVVDVNKQLGNIDTSFIEGAWREFKVYYLEYLTSYVSAINGLTAVFKDCLPKGVLANEMTYLVLDNFNTYLENINADFDKATGKINFLQAFTSYLNKDNKILSKYPFSENLKEKIELVQSFSSVYGHDVNLATLIKSINDQDFTFSRPIADEKNVLETAKKFLKGELSV